MFSTAPAGRANAQAIARQITLVVPYSAGGGTDTVARLIGNQMSRTLGQPIVIENVVGAGGTRANERVARSEPNGTTVLINHVALLAAPSLFTNFRYDTVKDFEAVGLVNNAPMLLVGRKSIPGTGAKGFCRVDQVEGRRRQFCAWRHRHQQPSCGVMMGNVLGFKPTFAAYRGSNPAITDLLAGQIDLLWDQVTNALPQVEAGMLHGIAITSTERLAELKDVPTTAELGMPEINYTMWHGLYVAKGTPKEIVAVINEALRKAVADPDIVAKTEAARLRAVPGKGHVAGGACKTVRGGFAARGKTGGELRRQAERGAVAVSCGFTPELRAKRWRSAARSAIETPFPPVVVSRVCGPVAQLDRATVS